jgi:hypothetical protein
MSEKKEDVWVRCQVCDKGFDTYPALLAHVYGHVREKERKLDEFLEKLYDKVERLEQDLKALEKAIEKSGG